MLKQFSAIQLIVPFLLLVNGGFSLINPQKGRKKKGSSFSWDNRNSKEATWAGTQINLASWKLKFPRSVSVGLFNIDYIAIQHSVAFNSMNEDKFKRTQFCMD